VLEQVRRRVVHAAAQAGGAKSSAFAGETDHQLVATAATLHLYQPVLEDAAAQVLVEVTHHEAR